MFSDVLTGGIRILHVCGVARLHTEEGGIAFPPSISTVHCCAVVYLSVQSFGRDGRALRLGGLDGACPRRVTRNGARCSVCAAPIVSVVMMEV